MGRAPRRKTGLVPGHPLLFDAEAIPAAVVAPEKDFTSLKHPLWTENKAKLIQEYIRLFTFVTKHGTYIDGFAAPQRRHHKEYCSANLVLQAKPQWVREFWLCDIDPKGVGLLEEIKSEQTAPKRRIEVVAGDFNETIHRILGAGTIRPTTATFALLDQRTFECDWATVKAIAQHKQTHKIELFYFLATGWLDRSLAAVRLPKTAERLQRWWGRPDWRDLQGVQSTVRGLDLAERFKSELGYTYAHAYPIHSQVRGGRIMYHMIHATDHEAAPPLMQRAYRKISGRGLDDKEDQHDLEALLAELRGKDALDDGVSLPDDEDPAAMQSGEHEQSGAVASASVDFGAPAHALEAFSARLNSGAMPSFDGASELDARQALRVAALRLASALDQRRPQPGEIGHNGPPLDDAGNPLPVEFVDDLRKATKVIIDEMGKAAPDALKVAEAASRLHSLKAWFKPRLDLFGDEFAKKLGSGAGVAVVTGAGLACTTLVPPIHHAVSAAAHWLSVILAAS